MKIGIIGFGFVGRATALLECEEVEVMVYDIDKDLRRPVGVTLGDLVEQCGLIFVSVPTPMDKDGTCHLGIVRQVFNDLADSGLKDMRRVVLRSTVLPGTSKELGCNFMPEFLTERNYEKDFKECKLWVFGDDGQGKSSKDFRGLIQDLFSAAKRHGKIDHDTCSFLDTSEAEMVKYFRNTFLATKVSLCNEFEKYCVMKGVDYSKMVQVAARDLRIGLSHTQVPGPDGIRGFGGTCFPKDVSAMVRDMERTGTESVVLKNVMKRNNIVDRPQCDWKSDKGRAIV